jgi:hypothetical protein
MNRAGFLFSMSGSYNVPFVSGLLLDTNYLDLVNSSLAPKGAFEGTLPDKEIFVKEQGMNPRQKRTTIAFVLLLAFAVSHFNLAIGSTKSEVAPEPAPAPPPIKAVLTTHGNRPITVNGAPVASGATIVAGTVIETPDLVGGTINLGALSSLEIAPNTKLTIDFDENGNMRVTLVRGCATVRTKQNVLGEVDTVQGVAGKTDPQRKGFLGVCFPLGASAPTVTVAESAGAAAAGGGILLALILGGVAAGVTLPFVLRGTNPSPSGP